MEGWWLAPPKCGVRGIFDVGRRMWVAQGGRSGGLGDHLKHRGIGEAECFGMRRFVGNGLGGMDQSPLDCRASARVVEAHTAAV